MDIILPVMLATTPIWLLLGCIIWQLEKVRQVILKRRCEKHKEIKDNFFTELEQEVKDGLTEVG